MREQFTTPEPPELIVELGRGSLRVDAVEGSTETLVEITGQDAESTSVQQHGRTVSVRVPREHGWRSFLRDLQVSLTVPAGSDLDAVLGTASLDTRGPLRRVTGKSGAGEVHLDRVESCSLLSGSGDVRVEEATGAVSVKTGSGDVVVRHAGGESSLVTGYGDIDLRTTLGPVQARTASGDVEVGTARHDVSVTTASGDVDVRVMTVGTLRATTAAGDITVGVPSGTPVWTDLSTVSGDVEPRLEQLGSPGEGQPYVAAHLRTVSGDIRIRHVPAEQPAQDPVG